MRGLPPRVRPAARHARAGVGAGTRKAPPELALRLRVALSREASLAPRRWQGLVLRFEDSFNSLLVPATAGAVSAVLFFALLMGFFTLPAPLEAAADSGPAVFYTPPQLAGSQFAVTNTPGPLMVDAVIDENGRVVDYRVISEETSETREALPEIKNMLLFTVFRPATSFGKPTTGRVVISFSNVNVKG